jgi:hypothetical protein
MCKNKMELYLYFTIKVVKNQADVRNLTKTGYFYFSFEAKKKKLKTANPSVLQLFINQRERVS